MGTTTAVVTKSLMEPHTNIHANIQPVSHMQNVWVGCQFWGLLNTVGCVMGKVRKCRRWRKAVVLVCLWGCDAMRGCVLFMLQQCGKRTNQWIFLNETSLRQQINTLLQCAGVGFTESPQCSSMQISWCHVSFYLTVVTVYVEANIVANNDRCNWYGGEEYGKVS